MTTEDRACLYQAKEDINRMDRIIETMQTSPTQRRIVDIMRRMIRLAEAKDTIAPILAMKGLPSDATMQEIDEFEGSL